MAIPATLPSIDSYIDSIPQWQQDIMCKLRQWIHQAAPDVEEDIKWGAPYFLVNSNSIVWMFAAKNWVHFAFPQGALLSSNHNLFEPTNNKAKRSIYFSQGYDMHEPQVKALIAQAVALARSSRKIDLGIPKAGSQIFELPGEYELFLKQHKLLGSYKKRPYYQQKGWVQWIEAAKHEATKDRRRQTMLIELRDGTYMPPKKSTEI